ncbi:unnamed protein product [Owenia fusiformis]|uniref:Uncharacterized protein n=1 Tax=Owenia fusiformis TaxID=6347 RepID=A0A8S4NI03_OWEFU|nr:unnamed protein product [Owenia fusiformis]
MSTQTEVEQETTISPRVKRQSPVSHIVPDTNVDFALPDPTSNCWLYLASETDAARIMHPAGREKMMSYTKILPMNPKRSMRSGSIFSTATLCSPREGFDLDSNAIHDDVNDDLPFVTSAPTIPHIQPIRIQVTRPSECGRTTYERHQGVCNSPTMSRERTTRISETSERSVSSQGESIVVTHASSLTTETRENHRIETIRPPSSHESLNLTTPSQMDVDAGRMASHRVKVVAKRCALFILACFGMCLPYCFINSAGRLLDPNVTRNVFILSELLFILNVTLNSCIYVFLNKTVMQLVLGEHATRMSVWYGARRFYAEGTC